MTKQEKMHTIELSERELAAILFLLYKTNGESTYQVWKRCTSILAEGVDRNDFNDKHESLSKMCGYCGYCDYHSVEKEWGAFLGIGDMNKVALDKIAIMERELAELKRML